MIDIEQIRIEVAMIELKKTGSISEFCRAHSIYPAQAADLLVAHAFALADAFVSELDSRSYVLQDEGQK